MKSYTFEYNLKFLVAFGIIWLGVTTEILAQYSLKGRVVDAETLEPLLFATVFISNSSIGTSTNKSGEFELTIPEGNHELVISYIGFQTFSYAISTKVLRPFYEFRILQETVELEESEVKEKRDKSWYDNLAVFKTLFLGTSVNASNCEIKNPEVLILDGETVPGRLTARAKDILEIENPNLGYNIKYVLTGFEYDKEQGQITYAGYPYFQEENLPKRRQKKVYENREKAYQGSVMHFMRSLYKDEIESSGFKVFATQRVPNPNSQKQASSEIINPDDDSKDEDRPAKQERPVGFKAMDSLDVPFNEPIDPAKLIQKTADGKVFITYNKPVYINFSREIEESSFFPYSLRNLNFTIRNLGSESGESEEKRPGQLSILLLRAKAVQVFENGSYYHPFDLFLQGYMAWEKIGDQLPLEYETDNK
ncbi:carboxypeptidase-like regulatory domain-containing protein [Aquiflexum gelatinilyticum]|uniref:Carboxypeptidase-like regulatory domain-containing protein n=1 Tax=Aquiflexum gelatinilyticum TaxID=2961943 RepID=A0A9X2P2Q4_9BACT|nr:carboxypeptidase-like regulatory domain-containing protein [Aquiflexum gelatinilyticum]MCR9014498.1 carboxypeptidase-like regulatory domain-containing protein [Aquiflexum gelatinilyticum]